MTKDALIEALAAIEHERWSDWQKYLHSQGTDYSYTGSMTFSRERKEAWERQINTPYAELSEREKESDRDQVMRYWPLIVEFVGDWLEGLRLRQLTEGQSDDVVRLWREEMPGE